MNKLITYAYFKEETDISSVVENTKLDNPIKNAQDRLKVLIGASFYDEIVSQVITLPKTLSTDNGVLFDPYIKQFLAWQGYYFYIVKANTYETRIGVRVFKEDNSDPASDKIMGEQIALAKQNVVFYKEALINFLNGAKRANSSIYPLYTSSHCATTGQGLGIQAVRKLPTTAAKINNRILNQEP